LAANNVDVLIDADGRYTPTPAISHAILAHNRSATAGKADGIVVTPSHNPPKDGGFKYNATHGGPADTDCTSVVAARANELLADGNKGVRRISLSKAMSASTTNTYDYCNTYVDDLVNVVDLRWRPSLRRETDSTSRPGMTPMPIAMASSPPTPAS